MIPPHSSRDRDPGQVVGAREFACDLLRLIASFDSLRRQRDVQRAVADGVTSALQLLPDSGLESLAHLVECLIRNVAPRIDQGTHRPQQDHQRN